MLAKKSPYPDIRIEIIQALLNDAIVSQPAFNAFIDLAESIAPEAPIDAEAWEAYKSQYVEKPEGDPNGIIVGRDTRVE